LNRRLSPPAGGPLAGGYRQLLSHRPYRLYFASSGLGAFASAVQFLAIGWLAVATGPSGWALGIFLAVRLGVKALMTIPAGLLADRYPRASIYASMRIVSGSASLVAAVALFTPAPFAFAIAAATLAAISHALDLPAHRALMGEVQPREQLERGLSFGSGGFHAAAMSAPIVAFPLAASVGVTLPLLLSAAAFFLAALPAFALIPLTRQAPSPRTSKDSRGLSSAIRYLAGTPLVLALVLATTVPSIVDKAVIVALPSTAGNGDHSSLGFVMAAPELGAITFGFVLAAMNWRFAPWIPFVSAGGYAAGVVAASLAGFAVGVEMIAVALFLAGCAKTSLITSALAGMQRHIPAEMRGRIMSF
jgi:MFS family permease